MTTVRQWVGLDSADTSQDVFLTVQLAGVTDLVAAETNFLLPSPPQAYEQVLDVPALDGGRLSGFDASVDQPLVLRDTPQRSLTGTVTVSAASKTVTGTGTKFLTELSADPASAVRIVPEWHLVDTITSDTVLTLVDEHEAGASGVTATYDVISIETRSGMDEDWTAADPRDFELHGRTLYAKEANMTSGRLASRIRFLAGYREGQGPAGIVHLILDMVKSAFFGRQRSGSSVSVPGVVRVDWSDYGEDAEMFRCRAQKLGRPVGFSQGGGRLLTGTSATW